MFPLLLQTSRRELQNLRGDINLKANIANANFTGTVKLEGKDLATKEYAESLVNAAKLVLNPGDTLILDGTI